MIRSGPVLVLDGHRRESKSGYEVMRGVDADIRTYLEPCAVDDAEGREDFGSVNSEAALAVDRSTVNVKVHPLNTERPC